MKMEKCFNVNIKKVFTSSTIFGIEPVSKA